MDSCLFFPLLQDQIVHETMCVGAWECGVSQTGVQVLSLPLTGSVIRGQIP